MEKVEIKAELKEIVSKKDNKHYWVVNTFAVVNGKRYTLGKSYFLDYKDKIILQVEENKNN